MKYEHVYALFLMVVFHTSCGGQNKPDPPKEKIKSETKDIVTSYGPNTIVRNVKQDRNSANDCVPKHSNPRLPTVRAAAGLRPTAT
jgi:hypothetical protein